MHSWESTGRGEVTHYRAFLPGIRIREAVRGKTMLGDRTGHREAGREMDSALSNSSRS